MWPCRKRQTTNEAVAIKRVIPPEGKLQAEYVLWFYKEARAKGVKPIIGCDVWITNEADRDKPYRLLLLCQSQRGYATLCELLSRAYRTNQYRGRAELARIWLAELGSEGLIALSGAHHGDIGQALAAANEQQAQRLADEWKSLFPQRFYIELQRLGPGATTSGTRPRRRRPGSWPRLPAGPGPRGLGAGQGQREGERRSGAELALDLQAPPLHLDE